MKRTLLALLALAALGGCAPRAADQAEICAILAQPAAPGLDQIGDARPLAALDRRLQAQGRFYGPGWRLGTNVRYWGRCPTTPAGAQMLLLSRDHTFAAIKGGPREHGLQRRFGTCFYAKRESRWRLLACRINGAS